MRQTIGNDMAPSFRAVLIGLSLAYLLLHLPFLDRVPQIVGDEPWYGNTAHNLANGQGSINTNVGQRGGDQFFVYPLVVSLAFRVFGTSLWAGRFVSVVLGLIGLWGLVSLCRNLAIRGWPLAVTGVLFIMSNVYFILFRRLRPEALVIVLSVWALYFFITAWETGKFKPALTCALLVGGSALAHPYGALLAALLGILLVARALPSRARAISVLGYATGGLGTILIFLIGWELLREQSLSDFLREGLDSGRLSLTGDTVASVFWRNLTTFVRTYSLGLERLYVLGFELGVLLFGLLRYRYDRLAGLLSLTGLFWLVTGLAIWTSFQRWAFSIPLIFSLVVTGRLLNVRTSTISLRGLKALWLFTLLYGANNLAGNAYVLSENINNTPYGLLTETLRASVPAGVPVLTHLEFWFAFHDFPENSVYIANTRRILEPVTSGRIRHVVLTSTFSQGLSPTTGRQEYSFPKFVDYYRTLHAYVSAHGRRVALLRPRGYGEIEIWEIRPPP